MPIYTHLASKAVEAAGGSWHPNGDFWLALALGLVGNGLTAYSAYILAETLKAIEKQEKKDVEKGSVGTAEEDH